MLKQFGTGKVWEGRYRKERLTLLRVFFSWVKCRKQGTTVKVSTFCEYFSVKKILEIINCFTNTDCTDPILIISLLYNDSKTVSCLFWGKLSVWYHFLLYLFIYILINLFIFSIKYMTLYRCLYILGSKAYYNILVFLPSKV